MVAFTKTVDWMGLLSAALKAIYRCNAAPTVRHIGWGRVDSWKQKRSRVALINRPQAVGPAVSGRTVCHRTRSDKLGAPGGVGARNDDGCQLRAEAASVPSPRGLGLVAARLRRLPIESSPLPPPTPAPRRPHSASSAAARALPPPPHSPLPAIQHPRSHLLPGAPRHAMSRSARPATRRGFGLFDESDSEMEQPVTTPVRFSGDKSGFSRISSTRSYGSASESDGLLCNPLRRQHADGARREKDSRPQLAQFGPYNALAIHQGYSAPHAVLIQYYQSCPTAR